MDTISAVFQNKVEVDEEIKLFQVFFLKEDNYQSVEVVETSQIDFEELVRCLNQGESIFIKRRL